MADEKKTPAPSPTNDEVNKAAYYTAKVSTNNVGFAVDHDPPPSPDWGKSRAAKEVKEEEKVQKVLEPEKTSTKGYKTRAAKPE